MTRGADLAHRDGGDAGLAPHPCRERHLVAGPERDARHAVAARGDVHIVAAGILQRAREGYRLVGRDAAFIPVGAVAAHAQRPLLRPGRAHGVEYFKREAHALVQAAAVGIAAPIGQWREERAHQVAVRTMQLDCVQAQARAAPGGIGERGDHAIHAGPIERLRGLPFGNEGDRRRRIGLPAAFPGWNAAAAVAGFFLRALAPRVAQLDADRHVAVAPHQRQHLRQRGLAGIGIHAQAFAADAPLWFHAGSLDDQEPGTGQREVAKMDQVPVGGATVDRAVLAHG